MMVVPYRRAIKHHRGVMRAFKSMLLARCSAAFETRPISMMNVGVFPIQPQGLEQKVFVIDSHVNRGEKVLVRRSYRNRSCVRWPEPSAKIAQRRQTSVVSLKSPVRVIPHAVRALDCFAAMRARQHKPILLSCGPAGSHFGSHRGARHATPICRSTRSFRG
jgi:hypothetical protein